MTQEMGIQPKAFLFYLNHIDKLLQTIFYFLVTAVTSIIGCLLVSSAVMTLISHPHLRLLVTCGTVTPLTQHDNPIESRSNLSPAHRSIVLVTSYSLNVTIMLNMEH